MGRTADRLVMTTLRCLAWAQAILSGRRPEVRPPAEPSRPAEPPPVPTAPPRGQAPPPAAAPVRRTEEPRIEWDPRTAAVLARLKDAPVAWLYEHRGDAAKDPWFEGTSHWMLFSCGHFFDVTVESGRVVERSAPGEGIAQGHTIRWWFERAGPAADPPLVPIPGRMRAEILRKTDTRGSRSFSTPAASPSPDR